MLVLHTRLTASPFAAFPPGPTALAALGSLGRLARLQYCGRGGYCDLLWLVLVMQWVRYDGHILVLLLVLLHLVCIDDLDLAQSLPSLRNDILALQETLTTTRHHGYRVARHTPHTGRCLDHPIASSTSSR